MPTTFSAGVSAVVESDSQPEQAGQVAMRAADALMYEAKTAGRDRHPLAWMSSCCLLSVLVPGSGLERVITDLLPDRDRTGLAAGALERGDGTPCLRDHRVRVAGCGLRDERPGAVREGSRSRIVIACSQSE